MLVRRPIPAAGPPNHLSSAPVAGHPGRGTLVAWAVTIAVLAALGTGIEGQLSPMTLAVPGTASAREQARAQQRFGSTVPLAILLRGPAGAVSTQGRRLVGALHALPRADILSPFASPAGLGPAGRALRPSPGSALLLVNYLRPARTALSAVPQTEALLARTVRAPVHSYLTGVAVIGYAIQEATLADTEHAELIALPVLILVLLAVFRSPVAAAVPLVMGGATVLAGRGLLWLASFLTPINSLGVAVAAMMSLALGVDYALLMVSRVRQEVAAGAGHEAAVRVARRAAGRTIAAAGGTLALSMLAASAVATPGLLGPVAIGVVISGLLSVALALSAMPALLTRLGPNLDRWSLRRRADRRSRLGRLGDWLIARPAITLPVLGLGMLALAAPAAAVQMGPPDAELPAASPARQAVAMLQRTIGPGWSAPFVVMASARQGPITTTRRLDALIAWQQQVAHDPDVKAVLGPGSVPQARRRLARADSLISSAPHQLTGAQTSLGELSAGLGRTGAAVSRLRAGLPQAEVGARSLGSGATSAGAAARRLQAGDVRARGGARGLGAGAARAQAGARRLTGQSGQALAGAQALHAGLDHARAGAAKVGAGVRRASAGARRLGRGEGQLAAGAGRVAAKLDMADRLAHYALRRLPPRLRALLPPRLTRLLSGLDQLSSGADRVAAGARRSARAAGRLGAGLARIGTADRALTGGLRRLSGGSVRLTRGLSRLARGDRRLAGGLGALNSGAQRLSRGMASAETGAGQLATGLSRMTDGAERLAAGLAQASGQGGQLQAGLRRAHSQSSRYTTLLTAYQRDYRRWQAMAPGAAGSGYLTLAALDGTVPALRQELAQMVNLNTGGQAAQITVIPASAPNSPATVELSRRLRATLPPLAKATGADVQIGEGAQYLLDYQHANTARFPWLVVALAIVATLTLVIVLRAVLLPLLAVALNLATIAVALGVLELLTRVGLLGGPGYLDAASGAGILAIMFVLSIDYEVFLLTRMREHWQAGAGAQEAIRAGLRHTAGVIAGSAAIMVAVFLAFAGASVIPLRQFGAGLTIAVLLDATIVRLVLLPTLMGLIGARAWWAPHWLERALPAIE